MVSAEQLADSIPALAQTIDRQALEVWLRRNGLTLEAIQAGAGRRPEIVAARYLAMSFLRRRGWSLQAIADMLGLADHSSVLHHLKRHGAGS